MVQVLHMSNGDTLNGKLRAENNRISQWLDEGLSDAAMLDRLFLTALSRKPQPEEAARLLRVIGEYPEEERRQAIEDVCWSVLTSGEFIFNQ
jgi:hypothetical protein